MWSTQLSYSLFRPRADTSSVFFAGEQGQTVNGTVTFSPTPNWTVNWNTSYSVTDGEFGSHPPQSAPVICIAGQANFDLTRTIYGNTSFSVSVRLIDLPDLKVDYRERDLGGSDNRR